MTYWFTWIWFASADGNGFKLGLDPFVDLADMTLIVDGMPGRRLVVNE